MHRRERGEEVARAIRADRGLGAADGLVFRFDRALFTTSYPAHHLTAQAAVQGRALQMADRLFRAYFTDGLHIAGPGVLARLAAQVGVRQEPDLTAWLDAELASTGELGSDTGPVLFVDGVRLAHPEPSEDQLLAGLREASRRGRNRH